MPSRRAGKSLRCATKRTHRGATACMMTAARSSNAASLVDYEGARGACLLGDHRQRLQTANEKRRLVVQLRLPVEAQMREAIQHHVECDAAFEPGQRRAEAVVDALAEADV